MHDNTAARAIVDPFLTVGQLCRAIPQADDILCGVLAARAEGDTATRTLSRRSLFRILQACPSITVEAVREALPRGYAERTLRAYAAAARVASRALAGLAVLHPHAVRRALEQQTDRLERLRLDAPYHRDLERQGLL